MAPPTGARLTGEKPAEIARLSDEPERSWPDSTTSEGGPGDFESTDIPSFRSLPRSHRCEQVTEQATRDQETDQEPTTRDGSAADAPPDLLPRLGTRRLAPTIASERSELGREIALARFPLRRFSTLACTLILGIGIGVGVSYMVQPIAEVDGGSAVSLRAPVATMQGRTAALTGGGVDEERSGSGAERSGPYARSVDGLKGGSTHEAVIGAEPSDAGGPFERSGLAAEERGGTDAGNAGLASLVKRARRQIAYHQLEQPPGDNALETYQDIVAVAPQHPAAAYVGESLSAAFWSLAMDAKAAEHWDDAVHDLEILQSLPPVPTDAILARSAHASTAPTQDAQRATTEQAPRASDGSVDTHTGVEPVREGAPVTPSGSPGFGHRGNARGSSRHE